MIALRFSGAIRLIPTLKRIICTANSRNNGVFPLTSGTEFCLSFSVRRKTGSSFWTSEIILYIGEPGRFAEGIQSAAYKVYYYGYGFLYGQGQPRYHKFFGLGYGPR